MKKAQISTEFLIITILVISMFAFALFVYAEKNSGFINSSEQFEAKYLATKLARTINNIHNAGNGTQTSIILEKKLGHDFNITISGNTVQVAGQQGFHDASTITDEIQLISASIGKKINIKNQNGKVIIQNA